MKTLVKFFLQKILGFGTYLYVFALFVIVKIRWDKKEKDFFHFMTLISEGGVILDLGANIGVTAYHLAKRFPQSRIFAFEPLETNYSILKRIQNRFKISNIELFPVAVGASNGTIEMVMPVIQNVPMHGLSHVVDAEDSDPGIHHSVPMIALDSMHELQTGNSRITAMKIDVENYEYFVLKGAEKLINKHRPVIYCELWDNENRRQCVDLLSGMGYSACVLHNKQLIPANSGVVEKHNFFFMPE